MRHAISIAVMMAVVCAFVSTGPVQPEQPEGVSQESAQAAYLGLPSGSDTIVNPIDVTFSCAQRSLGYYADVSNDCKIFHVCNPVLMSDGQVAMMQYSFVCPNQTLFDQQTLTCTLPPGTAPCRHAENFYYLNRHVGQQGHEGVPPAAVPEEPQQPQHPQPHHPQPQHPQPQLPEPDQLPEPQYAQPQQQHHDRPAVVPEPKHEAPQVPPHTRPAGLAPTTDDHVVRPASYYGGRR
ncbi:uncharacterized protein LOC144143149 [Haemaphysalis longicornis]